VMLPIAMAATIHSFRHTIGPSQISCRFCAANTRMSADPELHERPSPKHLATNPRPDQLPCNGGDKRQ
jgi:hypothetical protein